MDKFIYPPSPQVDTAALTKPGPQYRSQFVKVILSILLFIVSYFLVLAGSFFLLYFALSSSLKLLGFLNGWIGLLVVLGLLLTTGMFFYFMVKFLFQVKKDEDLSRIEIHEKNQPELFAFIARICAETKAPLPKKVVISPHVNACVYYNSSFLSMFFPVRKNLEIGAGLLNSVNLTEFKAVLAHELGHFSQSSTRLGSYTYSFSRMTNNLLYENDSWVNTLNSLSSIHVVLALFGQLTVFLVKGAMSFFTGVYTVTHRTYMALSREMEFHADLVAVSVTGSAPIISALHRLEFGQEAFNYSMQGVQTYKEGQKIQVKNFFQLHTRNIHYLAQENGLVLDHALPVIDSGEIRSRSVEARLKYKDIWASHPSIEEREASAMRVELPSTTITESPWILFRDAEKLQEELSARIADLFHPEAERIHVETPEMIGHFAKQETESKVNPLYNSFYSYASNTSSLPYHDDKELLKQIASEKPEDLFKPEVIQDLKHYYSGLNDLETMRLISDGHLNIRRFQFDGKTYTRYYSGEIHKQLKEDLEKHEKRLMDQNRKISSWFYALSSGSALGDEYFQHLQFSASFNEDLKPVTALLDELVKFYNEHILRYTSAEDIPYQAKKLSELYLSFCGLEQHMQERIVPEKLRVSELFGKGYKASVLSEVHDPSKEPGLNGLNPLFEDLKKIADQYSLLDSKIRKQVLVLQDEILAKHYTGI